MEQITIKQTYTITDNHYIIAIGHLMVLGDKVTKKSVKETMINGLQAYGQDCYLADDGFDWSEAEAIYNKMYN